jgi:hypothetical protein
VVAPDEVDADVLVEALWELAAPEQPLAVPDWGANNDRS